MFQLFRSFLPLHNPIGFGTSDFIELALAALLVLLIVAHAGLGDWARRLAARTGWCMLALAILPIALRLAMLAQSPAPTPNGSGGFFDLLVARTLRHLRPACPPPCATSAWRIRRIRCTSFSKPSSCCRSPLTVPSFRLGRAWHWRSDGCFSAIHGLEWRFRWRRFVRCATGCCGPGLRRVGRWWADCWLSSSSGLSDIG